MIYFIRSPHGPIKIGATNKMMVRLSNLKTIYGSGLELIAVMDGLFDVESKLIRRFRAIKVYKVGNVPVSREWFRPEPELTDYIRTHGRPWVPADDSKLSKTVGLFEYSFEGDKVKYYKKVSELDALESAQVLIGWKIKEDQADREFRKYYRFLKEKFGDDLDKMLPFDPSEKMADSWKD